MTFNQFFCHRFEFVKFQIEITQRFLSFVEWRFPSQLKKRIFGRPFNSEWQRKKKVFDKHENDYKGRFFIAGTKAVKRALKSISTGFTCTPCHIVVV